MAKLTTASEAELAELERLRVRGMASSSPKHWNEYTATKEKLEEREAAALDAAEAPITNETGEEQLHRAIVRAKKTGFDVDWKRVTAVQKQLRSEENDGWHRARAKRLRVEPPRGLVSLVVAWRTGEELAFFGFDDIDGALARDQQRWMQENGWTYANFVAALASFFTQLRDAYAVFDYSTRKRLPAGYGVDPFSMVKFEFEGRKYEGRIRDSTFGCPMERGWCAHPPEAYCAEYIFEVVGDGRYTISESALHNFAEHGYHDKVISPSEVIRILKFDNTKVY